MKPRPDGSAMHERKRGQMASSLQRAVQAVLVRGINDPRITGIITVTSVEVAPDFSAANVMVSVLPAKYEARVLAGLKHCAAYIRRRVDETLDTARVPELHFQIDHALKRQADVFAALAKVAQERDQRGEAKTGEAGGESGAHAEPEKEKPRARGKAARSPRARGGANGDAAE